MLTIVKGIVASIILWFLIASLVSWIGHRFLIPEETKLLVERGKLAYGKVVGREAQDHQRIDYAYSVDGIDYSGSGQGGSGNASFDDLPIGATVVVYYDSANPSVSGLGSPEYELQSFELMIRAAAIAIPFWPVLIFFLIYFALTRARRSSRLSEPNNT